jgi:hypothetical protein
MMKPENRRRTLAELKILYKTHPRIRDVFVEGRTDAKFYGWFLRESGLGGSAQVYEVDARVEIPETAVKPVHAEVNKRGRLFALGHAANSWGAPGAGATCIVDSDFDILEPIPRIAPLLLTDYPALEVYALQKKPFAKFLDQFVDDAPEADEVLGVLLPVWLQIFVVRFVLLRYSAGHALLDGFAKRSFDKFGKPSFSAESIIRDSTHESKDEVSRLVAKYAQTVKEVTDPALQTVRGHDVAPVIIQYLGLKKELARATHVENVMRACIEFADLRDQPLFQSLLSRLAAW